MKVVREDPSNPALLYAGTEFGLYASADAGRTWTRIGELPTVAVDDIVLHPRERDLVVATHGRSLYVIDDVRPLEESYHVATIDYDRAEIEARSVEFAKKVTAS